MPAARRSPPKRRAYSPAVVHSPLRDSPPVSPDAVASPEASSSDDMISPDARASPFVAKSPASRRRRKSEADASRVGFAAVVPQGRHSPLKVTPPQRSRLAACARASCAALVLLALVMTTVVCATLFVTLLSSASGMAVPDLYGLNTLSVDPPCAPPPWEPPELLALPAPPSCHFSWLRFRCAPTLHCQTQMRWLPIPRAKCSLRPEF